MTLALLQSDRIGLRKGFAIDHPVIEIAMPGKFRAEDKRNTDIRISRFTRTRELRVVPLRFRRSGPVWLALLARIFEDDAHSSFTQFVARLAENPDAGPLHLDCHVNPLGRGESYRFDTFLDGNRIAVHRDNLQGMPGTGQPVR